MGFTPFWDFKPTNANHVDSRGAYTNEKILKLSTKDKIHLKCDAVDGCVVDGSREAKPFGFVLKNVLDIKFSVNLKLYIKKIYKSVRNTLTDYLEDDDHEKVNFNGETLTFNSQLIEICSQMSFQKP